MTQTTKVFITGDRHINPILAPAVLAKVLQRLNKQYGRVEVYTGFFETGVERAVRYLIPDVQIIFHDLDENGHAKLDERHKAAQDACDLAVVIHSDPLASRVGKSVVDYFPGDKTIFA